MRVHQSALAAVALCSWLQLDRPLPAHDEFLSRVRAAIRLDDDLQRGFSYRETRRDVKVSVLGKVTVSPRRTFQVFPSEGGGEAYKRLIAVDDRPLEPFEVARRDAEHLRDLERDSEKRARETPQQRAIGAAHQEEARRERTAILNDALSVFETRLLGRDTLQGTPVLVVGLLPRVNARVETKQGGWMKQFEGRAWFVEDDGQLARLDVQARQDLSIGWGIVGRLQQGSRLVIERQRTGTLWLPARQSLGASGRTLIFRPFRLNLVTEYSDYQPLRPEGSRSLREEDRLRSAHGSSRPPS